MGITLLTAFMLAGGSSRPDAGIPRPLNSIASIGGKDDEGAQAIEIPGPTPTPISATPTASPPSATPTATTALPPPPENDQCESAFPVGFTHGPEWFSLLRASNDGSSDCACPDARDVWFVFTPASSGLVRFSVCNYEATESVNLSLHAECPGTVENQLACSEPAGAISFCLGTHVRQIIYAVTAGVPVFIRAAAAECTAVGLFEIDIAPLPGSSPTPSPLPSPTAVPCCPGDADRSGSFVDAADFISVQSAFGADNGVGGPGDANCSGSFVDAADFIAVQANFGADCG